ncbi:MAG: alkaline phosphatase family protein [Gammaproteobacteria bacterium]|nr:alkaline phosphatase family protein [Gammaproteobacteria bacterium]
MFSNSLLVFPPDSCLPDYRGGSILNLMASVSLALGVETAYEPARLFAGDRLGRKIVLLIVDGLGITHLKAVADGGFLDSHCLGSLTSVVPSATAAAIPVFLTGEPPARHGFPGWFTWFRELATAAAILPFATRAGFMSLTPGSMTPRQLSQVTPFTEQTEVPSWHITPQRICRSAFTNDFSSPASVVGYKDMRELIRQTGKAVSRFRDSGYVYTYWADYDSDAHHYGIGSEQAAEHLRMLDEQIEKLALELKGQDVDLLVCADHGFTDCPTGLQYVFSEAFPELAEMTQMPLTGEPRLPIAHLKTGCLDSFIQLATEQLQGIASPVLSSLAIEEGLLGPGKPHPELRNRLGDVLLLMHENTVIFDPLGGEFPPDIIGHHGGLSREEMLVPLIHIHC